MRNWIYVMGGDIDYVDLINSKRDQNQQGPLFSELIKYTKSEKINQLEDSITISLAICLKSDPKPFINFLLSKCKIDFFDKNLKIIWPQFSTVGEEEPRVEPDLVLGFGDENSNEIDSCLIIEAKVKNNPLDEKQLESYLSTNTNCAYLFITAQSDVELTNPLLKKWKSTTWQELTNFLLSEQSVEGTLWNDFIRHKASNDVVIDLRGEPIMEIENIKELKDTVEGIMPEVAKYLCAKKTELESQQLSLIKGNAEQYMKHMYLKQFRDNARFTLHCEIGVSNLLIGLFQYFPEENKKQKKWYAGVIIERHPQHDFDVLKDKLKNTDIEQSGWVFPDKKRSKGTSFAGEVGVYLVAMKSKLLSDSDFSTKNDVVVYINGIIDEIIEPGFATICKEIIYKKQ